MEKETQDLETTSGENNEYNFMVLKYDLEQLKKRKWKNIVLIDIVAIFFVLLLTSGIYIGKSGIDLEYFLKCLFFGFFIGTTLSICRYLFLDIKENEMQRRLMKYESTYIQEEAQENIYANSIKMSYKYLDQYYAQIKEQAHKGFFITVCISIFGAILIGIGIVSMFIGNTNPSYITCASGVITEFISTIFFFMYNKTIMSMSKYHNKLVLSHNVSIALKVADTLPNEDMTKSKNLIISELLKDMNSHLTKSYSEDIKNSVD